MIRTLIVDDEPMARKRLRRMLGVFPDLSIVDEASNGPDAVAAIESVKPDLLFLDIQMPDLDGFGVLRMIDKQNLPLTVFVTAHDEYAIDAFEVNAIDYLLKPIRRARLDQAIEKVTEKLGARAKSTESLSKFLVSDAALPRTYIQRLPVRVQGRVLILAADEITSFRVDRGLVFVTAAAGEFWTKYTSFGPLEGQLDPQIFLRVHRQSIVNLNKIREVKSFDNNTASLVLSCGREVQVSRAQMKQVREALGL
ncbi:MAG TPA: response regulator [Blastocatellia bacterium]